MARTPKADFSAKGISGLPVWAGRVYDEPLAELQAERGRKIFREMSEQDPIIGGILLGVEMLSRQVTWMVKPADDSKKAKKVSEFIDGALSDLNPTWEDTLSEILSMLTYGWSWMEIVYKRREGLKPDGSADSSLFDDGKIGWRSWSIRSQETLDEWEFENPDGTGELQALIQVAPPDYTTRRIPRSKSLHFTTRSRRENPEGVSMLRNSYRAWYMKKNIEVIEGIGVERDLAGLPVLWAPSEIFSDNATPEQKAMLEKLKKIVTSIKRDEQEGILMPLAYDEEGKDQYKLELLSTGGDRQFDTNAIINRYDERIAMSMLADFILMGHQAVGSFALSTTKTGLFSTALGAILDLIAAEINLHAIPKLVRLNGWPLDMVPTLMHGNIEEADLSKLGAFLKQLSDSGMMVFPNEPLEKFLLEAAGLPNDPGGAGQLPVAPPRIGPDGRPLPPQPAPLPLAPGQQPVSGQTSGIGRPAPKETALPRRTPQRTALHGEQSRKRFVPLSTRVARISDKLSEALESEEYTELLDAVMTHKKFSLLSTKHQELILDAEASDS